MGTDAPHAEGLLATLVERHAGLHYGAAERELFRHRVDDVVAERGFDSLLDYYYHLRYDPEGSAELDRLVEGLLVHETYFFRELRSLEVAVDRFVVPTIAATGYARIWSAACSTGEEPLSIAVLLAERGLLQRCEIVATDLSEAALAKLEGGRYRPRSLRGEGLALADRWLHVRPDEIGVPEWLRNAITPRRLNLCHGDEIAALGRFDLVVCRHVMIYFDDARIAAVVSALADSLRPDGVLVVGVSESLMRFSTELRCEEIDGTFVYRRSS